MFSFQGSRLEGFDCTCVCGVQMYTYLLSDSLEVENSKLWHFVYDVQSV